MWLDRSEQIFCCSRLLVTDHCSSCRCWKKWYCFSLELFTQPAAELFFFHLYMMGNLSHAHAKHFVRCTFAKTSSFWDLFESESTLDQNSTNCLGSRRIKFFFWFSLKSSGEELVSVVTGSNLCRAIVRKTHLFSLPLKWMHNLGECCKIMKSWDSITGPNPHYFAVEKLNSNRSPAKTWGTLCISGGWISFAAPSSTDRDCWGCFFPYRSHQMWGTSEVPVQEWRVHRQLQGVRLGQRLQGPVGRAQERVR